MVFRNKRSHRIRASMSCDHYLRRETEAYGIRRWQKLRQLPMSHTGQDCSLKHPANGVGFSPNSGKSVELKFAISPSRLGPNPAKLNANIARPFCLQLPTQPAILGMAAKTLVELRAPEIPAELSLTTGRRNRQLLSNVV